MQKSFMRPAATDRQWLRFFLPSSKRRTPEIPTPHPFSQGRAPDLSLPKIRTSNSSMKFPNPAVLRPICAVLCLGVLSGCSVFMAANQPDKKDLSVLTAGTPRAQLLEEFGQPLSSRLQGEKRIDLFSFVQGYRREVKAARAFGHGVGDIATAGLWEFAGTSTETVLDGKKLSFEVTYNRSDLVERVVRLSD
jgi:hypothetical protein